MSVRIPQDKAELLAILDEEAARWDALLVEVGEERMELPGPMGEWTFRDMVAHISAWRVRTLARLTAAQQGTDLPPPPWPAELTDDDTINTWMQEQNAGRPLGAVLAESRAQLRQMRELVAAIPEDQLMQPGHFPWMEEWPLGATVISSLNHYAEEHEPSVRAWLDGQAAGAA